jgi:hypothetical protein
MGDTANAVALPDPMDATTQLEQHIEQVRTATTHGAVCEPLVAWCGLEGGRQTYGWFGMLVKRHGIEAARCAVIQVLEKGWTVDDFEGKKGFKAYLSAMVIGTAERGPDTPRSKRELGKYDRV